MIEPAGHVIFLNGTSSSGKTTLARALQRTLPAPHFHASVDSFFDAYPDSAWEGSRDEVRALHRKVCRGFYFSVCDLALTGNQVIVDDVVDLPWMLEGWASSLAGLDVLFVGVQCDPDELDRREMARGDRTVGLARSQINAVHIGKSYDLEVDTSRDDPDTCARQIVDRLAEVPPFNGLQMSAVRPQSG